MVFTQQCAAPGCTNPSTRRGEHVLPNWLMRAFTTRVWSPGPYRAEHSSRGVEHVSNQTVYTKLPCCEEHNEKLGKYFEHQGQKGAKQLFGIESLKDAKGDTYDYAVHPLEEQVALDQAGADLFARWLVKTMVLNHHPETEREMNSKPVWTDRELAGFPTEVFADLFNGIVPEGMNAWIAVSELEADTKRHLDVGSRVSLEAAIRYPTALATWGLALRHGTDGRSLDVQLVWAPGLIVLHPDEETGAATRVWPRPPARLRVADLPVLGPVAASRFRSTFYSGGGGFVHEPGRTPVIAKGVGTLAVSDTARGHDLHWWDSMDTATRIDAVLLHLRRTGVLEGEITQNGRLTS